MCVHICTELKYRNVHLHGIIVKLKITKTPTYNMSDSWKLKALCIVLFFFFFLEVIHIPYLFLKNKWPKYETWFCWKALL